MMASDERLELHRIDGSPGWGIYLAAVFCTLLFLAASSLLSSLLGGLNVEVEPSLVLVGFGVMLLTIFVLMHDERLWIYSSVLAQGLVLIYNLEGIGPAQVLFILYVEGGLCLWFAKELLVFRRRIVHTGFDLLLLAFFILASIVAVLGYQMYSSVPDPLAGRLPLIAFKEWAVLSSVLLYFPLRKVMTSEREVRILLGMFVILALANGAVNVLTYRSRLVEAVYAYQILGSRVAANEPIAIALTIIGAAVFGYRRERRWGVIGLVLAGAGFISTLISFSRSYILMVIVSLALLMVLAPRRASLRVLMAMMISIVVGGVLLYLLFPGIFETIGQSITRRLLSTARGSADISLNARFAETRTLLEQWIPGSPVIGHGFGTRFTFADPLSRVTPLAVFIHNGYIWALFKFGIPVALLYYGVLAYPLIRLLVVRPLRSMTFNHAVMAGVMVYQAAALTINLTSSQFTTFSGVLNFTLCWALLDYVHRSTPTVITAVRRVEAAGGAG